MFERERSARMSLTEISLERTQEWMKLYHSIISLENILKMSLVALERTLEYEYLTRFSHSNTGNTTDQSSAISLSGFDAMPSVIAGFQGCSDDQWANVRFTGVTSSSIGLNIEGKGDHGSETLGYIAFETSTAESSQYLASHTLSSVHEEHYTLEYAYTFDDVPLFFGTVESSGGTFSKNIFATATSTFQNFQVMIVACSYNLLPRTIRFCTSLKPTITITITTMRSYTILLWRMEPKFTRTGT